MKSPAPQGLKIEQIASRRVLHTSPKIAPLFDTKTGRTRTTHGYNSSVNTQLRFELLHVRLPRKTGSHQASLRTTGIMIPGHSH